MIIDFTLHGMKMFATIQVFAFLGGSSGAALGAYIAYKWFGP